MKILHHGNLDQVLFNIEASFSIGSSIRLVPVKYKNVELNYDESIPLGKYPTCSWSADSFTNWLTKESINIQTQLVSDVANIAVNPKALNPKAIVSVAGNALSEIGNFRKAALMPSITGGNNTGDVNFSNGSNTFIYHKFRVKTEYLKIIDDFFSRFGYKINRVKKPNITGRPIFNFVEIGSDEIIGFGELPSKDLENINNSFKKGITIWHNHSNIGNFELNNK